MKYAVGKKYQICKGGARMTQGGANAPRPPLNTALGVISNTWPITAAIINEAMSLYKVFTRVEK